MTSAGVTRTALLSVFHKKGIVDFARELVDLKWRLLASGGTAKALSEAGLPVRDVAELVGSEAILGHKVVTLSREVHAGLLADYQDDREEMERLGLSYIDLACIDLYPLAQEERNPDSTLDSIREKTDIGGPTMLRSAAKGKRIVICDPNGRQVVLDWLKKGEPHSEQFRNELAIRVERTVGDYCKLSAELLRSGSHELNSVR